MAAIVAGVVIAASTGGATRPAANYGGIPSWLPKTTAKVGRVVTASGAHPRLAIQGDTVRVDTGRGTVLTTVVGPNTPEQGRFPVPKTSPVSFVVTFAHATGEVPLHAKALTVLAENSLLYHLRVRVMGGGRIPSHVPTGRTISLILSGVLPTGGGQLRWAPDGGTPISSWDFEIEID